MYIYDDYKESFRYTLLTVHAALEYCSSSSARNRPIGNHNNKQICSD